MLLQKGTGQDNGLFADQSSGNEEAEFSDNNTSTTSVPGGTSIVTTPTTALTTTAAMIPTSPTIKKEIIDGPSANELTQETISQNDDIDIDEWKMENDDIPCSVKTKPYYSINAKLAQKEKKQQQQQCTVNGPPPQSSSSSSTRQCEKITFIDNKIDENLSINDEQQLQQQNLNIDDGKGMIIDTNYRYLTSQISPRGNQNNNKTSVTCLICGKQLSNQYNLRVHMETHSNSSYSCTACSHVSRSRDALRKHVSYRHPVATPQKRPRFSLTKP